MSEYHEENVKNFLSAIKDVSEILQSCGASREEVSAALSEAVRITVNDLKCERGEQ